MIYLMIIFYYQMRLTNSHLNVYQTDKTLMMSAFGYDCFYYDQDLFFDIFTEIIPFCRRPETLQYSNEEEEELCHGKMFRFNQLKTNNINPKDLYHWNSAIEIIDLYEKYLFSNHPDHDHYYCNCSVPFHFGKSCQYDIDTDDTEQSFTNLIDGYHNRNQFLSKNSFTCYIGIHCQTNLFCLDWRQICNGIVDCDDGEDEPSDLCSQMESNECDPKTEFRCQNGMCIPTSMSSNVEVICFDRSDEVKLYRDTSLSDYAKTCAISPSFNCDGSNLGWKKFSCNNGQYISYEDLTSRTGKQDQTCTNNHHIKYLKRLFSVNDENRCWKAMICLTGFDYLYLHINCSHQNIEESCPNEYYFPPNSVVYSFVFFLYDKLNHGNWIDSSGPDYICYKNEYCQTNNFTFSTIIKDNLRCFSVNQRMFSWQTFYEYITHLFSSCFHTFSSDMINNPMFYRCDLSDTYISVYRVRNKRKDCYFNEDEYSDINLCSLKANDLYQCLSTNNECVRQSFINDDEYDCLDGSDEYFYPRRELCTEMTCDFYHWSKKNLDGIYAFNELCDNRANRHLFPPNSTETDETDCEYWPYSCNSPYTQCDGAWSCSNGEDELPCEKAPRYDMIRKKLRCKSDEHYCIRLINGSNITNIGCININRAGDEIIDCIGGTDERLTSPCLDKYPYDFKRRFLCMNSSVCIRTDQVCDTIPHCPLGDDEHVCPWLIPSNFSTFSCSSTVSHSVVRCPLVWTRDMYCPIEEHLWFCDLQLGDGRNPEILWFPYERYPQFNSNIKSISTENINLNEKMISEIKINNELFSCNFGYLVRSSKMNNRSYCFCPPSYYGDYCQYQSEHLIVWLKIQIAYAMETSTVFRLVLYLLNELNLVVSSEEVVCNVQKLEFISRYVVHLMYERVTNLSLHQRSKSRSVRLDSYIIKPTTVHYIASWLFHFSFPFLPVNKLVTKVSLRNELFRVMNCKKRCGSHGRCMYYISMRHVEYCWCEQGWSGDQCEVKSPLDLCNERSCAAHAQCVIVNEEKKQTKCICPLGRYGDRCYIKHDAYENVQCQNNGTFLSLDPRKPEFSCACGVGYTGEHCEDVKSYTYISIDANITDLSVIPAIIVINSVARGSILVQRNRILYKDTPLPTTVKIERKEQFTFVQIFHSYSTSFYYLALILESKNVPSYLNTSVITRNRCKNISEVFNQTILHEYSYLKRLKLYHLPCKDDHNLRCFFDQYRICLCTRSHNSYCYLFNHERGNCDYCQNDGLCLRQNSNQDQWIFTCLCQKCSYGALCQFSPANYFITLDMLIGTEMKTENISFNQQSVIVHLTLIFLIILLLFSLIFNTISAIVFSSKKLRQVGCDLYLLCLTIVSKIGLILLFLRFIYTMMVRMYVVDNDLLVRIGCISLEYLLRLVPSLFDWLTVCISVERAYTLSKDIRFTKVFATKTLKISRLVILIVFLVNILTTLHRPFHLRLVDEPSFGHETQGHPWCVLDFDKTSWNTYEKVINLCHLLIPLILNILSIIIFLSYKVNFELKLDIRENKANVYGVIKEQLLKYKALLISTTTIIILEIPRIVLTLTLACIDHPWQRYVYLIGYLISFLPLAGIVLIYVVPSPKYRKQFKIVVTRIFRISLCKKH